MRITVDLDWMNVESPDGSQWFRARRSKRQAGGLCHRKGRQWRDPSKTTSLYFENTA